MVKLKKMFSLILCVILIIGNNLYAPNTDVSVKAASINAVIVDPSLQYQTIEGWGTSLAWWGDLVGKWSSSAKNEMMDLAFDPVNGLGLNIVRYNIGGGENPAHDHMRPGGEIEGYQPSPGVWDWNVDAGQRWVLQEAKNRIPSSDFIAEAFSNSPPYWMTVSECASGATDGGNNLKDDQYVAFADYFTEVIKHFKDTWGITFQTADPLNEPYVNWWKANGGQEGCHFDRDKQALLIKEVYNSLAAKGLTDTKISASDETSIDTTIDTFNSFDDITKSYIGQINTHEYGGSKRAEMRDLAASQGKPLYMDEICTSYGHHDHNNMDNGLALADYIFRDMRDMKSNAWEIWQFADDEEKAVTYDYNYGLIHAYWAGDNVEKYYITKQYYAVAHFSKFIRPGYRIIDTNNSNVVAAYDSTSNKLVLVTRNTTADDSDFVFDLSKFNISSSNIEAYRTSATENLAAVTGLSLSNEYLYDTLPSKSMVTYVISDIDYIGAVGTTINDNVKGTGSNQFDYGNSTTWNYYNGQAGAYSNDVHYTNTQDDSLKVSFTGNQVKFYGAKNSDAGIAAISIDNGVETMIDFYSASRMDNALLYTSPLMENGTHTLKVRVTGDKNASSSGCYLTADKVVSYEGATGEVTLNKPVLTALNPGDGRLTVVFSPIDGAVSYNIKYGVNSGTYTTIINNVTDNIYNLTGLENGKTYYVAVSAVNGQVETANSNELSEAPIPADNPNLLYYVNAGDNSPLSLENGEIAGTMNKSEDQAYGRDSYTGYYWGYVTDEGGTWSQDDQANVGSNYGCLRQYDGYGQGKGLEYKFELPNGSYKIAMGFYDPWNISWRRENIVINGTTVETNFVPFNQKTSKEYVAEVTDGKLSVKVVGADDTSDHPMISWISVSKNVDNSLMLQYKFDEGSGTTVADSSGNNRNGILNGTYSWTTDQNGSGAVELDGTNGYITMPNGILAGVTDITVTTNVYVDPSNVDPVWIYTFGSAFDPVAAGGTKYFGLLQDGGHNLRSVISLDRWSAEQNTAKGGALAKGVWKHIAYTLSGTTGTLYEDGVQIARETNITDDPKDIEATIANFIGRPAYPNDKYFKGKISDFRIYTRALSAEEIYNDWLGSLNAADAAIVLAKAKLAIPNAEDVRGNITLPQAMVINGETVNITWETDKPEVVNVNGTVNEGYDNTPAGVVTRQDIDTQVTLTAHLIHAAEVADKVITITVKAKPAPISEDDYKGYLFAYFTGVDRPDAEQLYFASSTDGLHYKELNENNPVLTSSVGDKGVRDPFILRSPEGDKFYMIATDLRIANGAGWWAAQSAGSKSIVVWESTDLVNWSSERLVKIARDDAGCTWAPEVVYDERTGEYVVFWASRIAEDNYAKQRIYVAKTRDFYTFTEPEVYIDRTSDVIDATIIKQNGIYYRFSKDEVNKNIIVEKCDQLLGKDFERISAPVVESQAGVEGPAIFKFIGEDKWCLLLDNYGGGGYYPLISGDLASGAFTRLETTQYQLPTGPRHGTVMQVTQAEYDAVMAKWSMEVVIPDEEPQQAPILEYKFDETDTDGTIQDSSGNNRTGALNGNAAYITDQEKNSQVLYLDGTANTFASLPQGFFEGRDTVTISMDIKPVTVSGNFFTFAIGKDSTKYMFLRTRDTEIRNALTVGSWSGEQEVKATTASLANKWMNLKLVITPTSMAIYKDGRLLSKNSNVTLSMSSLGKDLLAYLGKSFYSGDAYFKGYFDNVKVYNRALSEVEIAQEFGITDIALIKKVSAAGYSVMKTEADTANKKAKVYFSRNNSTLKDLTAVPLTYELAEGCTIDGTNGAVVNLTNPVKVTINVLGQSRQEWTVEGVLGYNQVLSGQYADPDIDAFDGKLYIYPTTDGFNGWSGTQFHVFSSDNMIDWTDGGVILDAGAGKDVPWAVGSAWAPTIEEKNGKYYFYFCAKRQDGASCIGVAVADSPAGPFTAQAEPLLTPEMASAAGVSLWQTIDPSIFTDDNGTSYLLFGNGGAAIVELNQNMISYKPETMKNISGATDFREAITVTKRNGLYHFTWSCDDTGSENYHVNYGTSDSLYGPIQYQYTLLSKDTSKDILGTGHHSIVKIPGREEYYIVYHRFMTPLGQYSGGYGYHRETCIDKLEFDAVSGLMKVVTPTLEGITMPVQIPEIIEVPGTDGQVTVEIVSDLSDGARNVLVNVTADNNINLGKNITIPTVTDNIIQQINRTDVEQVNISVNLPDSLLTGDNIKNLDINLALELLQTVAQTKSNVSVSVNDETGKELYSWSFNATDIANSKQSMSDVNLTLSVEKVADNTTLREMFKGNSKDVRENLQNGVILSFNKEGILPAQACVRIYVGNMVNNTDHTIYLYHYNQETGKLDTLPDSSNFTVDSEGYVTINLVHCSNYVVLPVPASKSIVATLLDQITISLAEKNLYVGGTAELLLKLPATLEIVNSLQDTTSSSAVGAVIVSYKSNNEKVATVDKNGKITAVGAGKAKIVITIILYNNMSTTITTTVTVKEP